MVIFAASNEGEKISVPNFLIAFVVPYAARAAGAGVYHSSTNSDSVARP
jgi:hypothetical protein